MKVLSLRTNAYRQATVFSTALVVSSVTLPLMAQEQTIETVEVSGQKNNGLNLDQQNSASNRLDLSAMDLPASVETIGKEDISIRGDYSSLSAVTRATGFASSASPGNGGTATSVRGFSGHGAVAYTYDGVRLYVGSGTVTFPADTWTVERVEVLRGAGSVITGIGAIGATVNYVSKQPEFSDIRSELDVTNGSDQLNRIAFGTGGALSDKTAFRLDAVSHQSTGYVDNGDESRRALSSGLLHRVNDKINVQFNLDYAETEQSPYWGTPLINDKIASATRTNNYNVGDAIIAYEDLWPRVKVEWEIAEHLRFRNDSFYMKADRQWRNVESYAYNEADNTIDRSFFLEILHEQEQWGTRNDLLIDFDTAGKHSHLNVGVEVNAILFTHFNNRPYRGKDSVDVFNPSQGSWFDNAILNKTTKDFTSETLQYALFADYLVDINEQLSIVSGVRYDNIEVDRKDFFRVNGPEDFELADNNELKFSGVSWRLGGVYQPSESMSLYAQYSQALDSAQSILSATNKKVDLGKGEQFEVGLKQSLWDDKAQYTIAIYDITKKNQLRNNIGNTQENVGEQSAQGIELDLAVQINEALSLDMNFALVDAEFNDFGDKTGNSPRNVPEKTANLWINWIPQSGWLVDAGARFVSERYSNDDNDSKLPEYTVFDAGIHWQASADVRLSARGKNLTDEQDYVLAPYGDQWILAQGRSFELGLDVQF